MLDPFSYFQLYDISVNRRGLSTNILSEPNDVLWNFKHINKFQKYSQEIAYLEIIELTNNNVYVKTFTATSGLPNTIEIKLTHKITECNYAHCVFEIWFNNQEVTRDNYKDTLKRSSELKTWCKNELSKMQIKGQIKLNW